MTATPSTARTPSRPSHRGSRRRAGSGARGTRPRGRTPASAAPDRRSPGSASRVAPRRRSPWPRRTSTRSTAPRGPRSPGGPRRDSRARRATIASPATSTARYGVASASASGPCDQTAGHHRGDAGEREERDEERRDEDGRPVVGGQRADRSVDPRFERKRSPDDQEGRGKRGHEPQPERDEPDATRGTPIAATDGRIRASIGTPAHASAGPASSLSTWSVPRSIAPSKKTRDEPDERRFEQTRQSDHGDGHEGQVAPSGAVRDRRAVTQVGHGTRSHAPRLSGGPREEVRPRTRC